MVAVIVDARSGEGEDGDFGTPTYAQAAHTAMVGSG
jgi:hypothetical protein